MSEPDSKILAVPTNIITGFLGAGKTTAILNLLQRKPDHERWAVLVNEFGEIGIDGAILQGSKSTDESVFIAEVPGGCMCCTAGLPVQIALAQLLRRSKPHRLIIEPTGLGHPVEILQTLATEHYREVLSVEKTLTLIDARNLANARYADHETFRQQLEIADIIVANKNDLSSDVDRENLEAYVANTLRRQVQIIYTQQGEFDSSLLQGPTAAVVEPTSHSTPIAPQEGVEEGSLPENGVVKAQNRGEGFESVGWRFSPDNVFQRRKLVLFLTGLTVERLKAVLITDEGIFAYNMTRDALTELELDDCAESRVEIIAPEVEADWERKLMDCLN